MEPVVAGIADSGSLGRDHSLVHSEGLAVVPVVEGIVAVVGTSTCWR